MKDQLEVVKDMRKEQMIRSMKRSHKKDYDRSVGIVEDKNIILKEKKFETKINLEVFE